MRTKIVLLFLLGWAGMVWGQTKEQINDVPGMSATLEPEDKENTDPEKEKNKEIVDLVKNVIKNNEDSKTSIGEIILKSNTIVYDEMLAEKISNDAKQSDKKLRLLYLKLLKKIESTKTNYKKIDIALDQGGTYFLPVVKIDSVKFDIQEGMLEFIKVYLNDGTTYTNKKSPIALLYLDKRGEDRLYNADGDQFVLLKNVVTFEPNKRFGFLPNDDTFSMKNTGKNPDRRILKKNDNINSLVSFTAYSDLLGLIGDEANALVNFEGKGKFFLNRHNLPNKFIYLFSSFQPYLHYNKVDSKFETIEVQGDNLNPVEIFRRHNFAVGCDLSFFKWDWRPANSLEVKGGYMFTSSRININTESTTANNHIRYFEVNLKSKIIENFGIDFNGKYMWQKLNDNEFFDSIHGKMLPLRGGIYYASPKAKGDDKIFIRFTNYLILDDRKKDFFQIQIGFTKSLNL